MTSRGPSVRPTVGTWSEISDEKSAVMVPHSSLPGLYSRFVEKEDDDAAALGRFR